MYATEFLDLPPLRSASGLVRLPGSKSISNRVLLLAGLCDGITLIHDLLDSDDTRVIVHVEGGERAGFYQLVRSSLELEPLPLRAPFYASERAGDTLYWSDGANPPSLMRARFDDAEAERGAPMERTEFDVGPGYALTRQERLVEPDYLVAQNFVLHDAATGRERPLPGMG